MHFYKSIKLLLIWDTAELSTSVSQPYDKMYDYII